MKKITRALSFAFALALLVPLAVLAASPTRVNLGTASNHVILAKTGVSTTGSTSVVGDIGVSPISATAITGFALTLPAAGAFSTSALVTGKVYASDYSSPTPANLTTAVLDMQTAYTDAASRAPTATELGAGNIGGLTLAPGVYKWGTGVTIPTDVTLSGSANDVWIFQIAQTLTVSSGVHIILAGGAQAANIFWQVAGQTTIGTTAVFNGNILDQTAIVLNTGARLNGRALAQTAVTLDSNAVTIQQGSVAPAPAPVPPSIPAPTLLPVSSPTPVPIYTSVTTHIPVPILSQTNQGQPVIRQAPVSNVPIRVISTDLYEGNRGTDVATLQQFCITQNKGPAARALATVGATGYFGVLTRAAVAEFQSTVGIAALGNFGPITRAYISAQY